MVSCVASETPEKRHDSGQKDGNDEGNRNAIGNSEDAKE